MTTTETIHLLDLTNAPDDPIERLVWLSGVKDQVAKELDTEYARTYGLCRFNNILESAISLGFHSRRRILAYTRRYNESVGRQIRWNDGR